MVGVKEMFMPEMCVQCPFYSGVANGTCLVMADSYENHTIDCPEYGRQDWCPLIEIEERDGE